VVSGEVAVWKVAGGWTPRRLKRTCPDEASAATLGQADGDRFHNRDATLG
jgi:hypothetical protein